MADETTTVVAHDLAPEPTREDGADIHAKYHLVRAIAFTKGWLDRDLWVEALGRPRLSWLNMALASAELARLWVALRDGEQAEAVTHWATVGLEDPDYWGEWLAVQAEKVGVSWDQIAPYGGDKQEATR